MNVDELLFAAESGAKVAAVGCLAERYGAELAGELPEAQILSFDDYGDMNAPSIIPGASVRQAIQRADLELLPQARRLFANSRNVAARLKTYCGIEALTCPASSMKRHSKPFCRAFHER